ncbi:MAG: hypothetical protein EA382_14345 [Spirochaetaceae bacterium]|nr:MAG: hypothetical protein EA382_14345 [Spirochaetaceae bacterium]
MKYELQTIPVLDAYQARPHCVLCYLERQSEERNTTFFLGNSIMAPEMRVRLNEHGFCPRHLYKLLDGEGKLGYSLALATHLDSVNKRVASQLAAVSRSRGRALARSAAEFCRRLADQERDCLMCERIRTNLLNFTYTVVRLYADEPEFKETLRQSTGFCFHHLQDLVPMAPEVLRGTQLDEWFTDLIALHERSTATVIDDLEAFTWQFDYQTELTTPEHARDAVPRAVAKLAGNR